MFLDKPMSFKIGEFKIENQLLSEVAINNPKKGDHPYISYIVEVYSNDEGDIPHFHIYSKNLKEKDCCIRISNNQYFKHGHHKDELNSNERKAFERLMNEKFNENENCWEFGKKFWNSNNKRHQKVLEDTKQPNYKIIIDG